MNCPSCGGKRHKVVWTRPSKGYPWIMRRRECQACHQRFTTKESPVKKAGTESASTAVG